MYGLAWRSGGALGLFREARRTWPHAAAHVSEGVRCRVPGNLAAMAASRRSTLLYWATQLVAWSGYVLLLGLPAWLEGGPNARFGPVAAGMVAIGIASSHVMRSRFKEWHWLDKPLGALVLRMVLGSLVLGALAGLAQAAAHDAAFPEAEPLIGGSGRHLAEVLLSWVVQLFVWSVAYVAYHYTVSSRLEKMRALRLEAANREGQLAILRSQLNPHFMFNALNGIRSLIDEDPRRAKESITRLSAILRNAMSTVRRRTVPLGEEIDTVRAYLDLESMRFEERLNVKFDLDPALERSQVPPMMLQTLVENAVRHGIAKSKAGGEVAISARPEEGGMLLAVANTGNFNADGGTEGGLGLRNTRERLAYIYAGKASMHVRNEAGMVVCELHLPLYPPQLTNEPTENLQP